MTLPQSPPEGAAAKIGEDKVQCAKKWRKESDWWALLAAAAGKYVDPETVKAVAERKLRGGATD